MVACLITENFTKKSKQKHSYNIDGIHDYLYSFYTRLRVWLAQLVHLKTPDLQQAKRYIGLSGINLDSISEVGTVSYKRVPNAGRKFPSQGTE
ncbi:hypothetical protein RRG08_034858 [Elysia crispata]|uniref:Uncharacterized protein n=1 Tax=Elysia crispata TaxID=231223 RepID=A0AAE1AMC1_9GAST|nr:hypothetical protein RRG08_034858 [Elysia crispata]